MKRALKIVLISLCAVLAVVLLYVGYVFVSYHRLGDKELLPAGSDPARMAEPGREYSVLSYNIGFGAYESDYGFFMDGGTQSWAWSKERLDANLKRIAAFIKDRDPDLCLLQEVDINSTRSYHFDERDYLIPALEGRAFTFAQNYDSPFLFYPLTQPHGRSRSGLLTFSDMTVTAASRVELPIETGFTKFLDLDRCYSKNRVPVSDGKTLVVYNLHLSAYTSDGAIATEQFKILLSDMQEEYENGAYCVAGGDFNKDLLGNSADFFGSADKEYTWAQPIPKGTFDGCDVSLVAPLDKEKPVPSCRNADSAYHEGQYVLTVDGFLVTGNVKVTSADVVDTGFAYSDHNPVEMKFILE